MAKIGSMELIVILIVAMLAIGPERMPKAARTLGKAVGSFKKYMNDATSDLREASDEFREVTDEIADAQKTVRKAFKDADDEISKTRGEAEEKLNPKKKKKKKPAAPASGGSAKLNLQSRAASELDIRGYETLEAESVVENYIDSAVMAKLGTVTIIHGKGTGALRKAVHEMLKRNKAVKSFRLGRYGEGEAGVTVVELK